MKNNLRLRWVRGYAAVVGVMDLATGLGLVTMPAFTLARMGAAAPGAEALGYVRFSGVFVGAVGASYLVALARGGVARLRGALEFTLIARAGAGGFSAVAVAAGWFDRAWLVVAATDLACAAIQAWILARGMADDE